MFKKTNVDKYLLIFWFFLLIYGIIAVYTASNYKVGSNLTLVNHYLKQSAWAMVSLVAVFVVLKLPYNFLEMFIVPGYVTLLLLLVVVLFMPPINGSRRWIRLGFSGLQPSEPAKLFTILLVSKLISGINQKNHLIIIKGILCVLAPVVLIILEPDLGTTIVFWVSLTAMFYASKLPKHIIIIGLSLFASIILSFNIYAISAFILLLIFYMLRNRLSATLISFTIAFNLFFAFLSPVLWNSLKPYQQERILTFIDPKRDPLGSGYQIIQAKIAIGSGGLKGKGILEGTQKNLKFLPEHHTDFIFSVIGEEFGFLGSMLLLALFLGLLSKIAWYAGTLKNDEQRIAASGILAYLAFQVFVNISMNLGLMPTTGIPLPFISYGGSNLLINSLSVAIVLKYTQQKQLLQ